MALFQILQRSGDLSSVSGGDEHEASWLIEPRASHMQTIFMPAFCSFESVKRKIRVRDRQGDIGGAWLDAAAVRRYHGNS